MRSNCAKLFLIFSAFVACGGSDNPIAIEPPPEIPPLEAVNFAALGSGKIAFQRIGPLTSNYVTTYILNGATSSSSRIFDHVGAEGPVLSPDGSRLAFMRYNSDSGYDIHVANVDGSSVTRVTSFLVEGTPAWHPDGSRIVFIAHLTGSDPQAYSQSPISGATDRTRHTDFRPGAGGLITCPTFFIGGEDRLSMSSQGRIVFACGSTEIDILSSTGTLAVAYVPARSDPNNLPGLSAPEWSPDGTRVAFIEQTFNGTGQPTRVSLKVMNDDATNVTTLASIPITAQLGGSWDGPGNRSLCWMPDGSRIVFTVPVSDYVSHLWVVGVDGSGLTQLTSADAVDRSVSCSQS